MSNSTITADLPRAERKAGGGSITIGRRGGGHHRVTLFPGPIANSKGQRTLNPHVFRHNTRTPKPFSHEVVTGPSITQENSQGLLIVDHTKVAMSGSNQYSDLGDGNGGGYVQHGYILSDPIQWLGVQSNWIRAIAEGRMDPDAWPANYGGYDTRHHWKERDAFHIVGAIPGYTKVVLLKCGVAFACGYSGHGQCGDGGASNRAGWRMVGWQSYEGIQEDQRIYKDGRKIVQIAGTVNGQDSTAITYYALTDDGRLWGWGYNGYGQTATNNATTNSAETYSPHQCYREGLPSRGESGIVPVTDAVYVTAACDQYGTVWYIDTAGKVWAAGRNNNQPMGDTYGNNQTYFRPVQHGTSGNQLFADKVCTKIAAWGGGDNGQALFLFADGTVAFAGYSGYGQAMTGSTAGTNAAQFIPGFGAGEAYGKAVDVWGGGNSYGTSYVKTEDNRLFGGGYSGYGQLSENRSSGTYAGVYEIDLSLGTGVAPDELLKIDLAGRGSTTHLIALFDDGTTLCGGRNNNGQRGGALFAANSYWWNAPGLAAKVIDVDAHSIGSDNGANLWLGEDGTCWGAGTWYVTYNVYYNAGYSQRNPYWPIEINAKLGT